MTRRRRSALIGPMLFVTVAVAIVGGLYWWVRPTSAADRSLTGTWVLTNRVTDTSYRRYKDDTHEFQIAVVQNGRTLEGRGEQTRYNGDAARNHYPLWFTHAEVNEGLVNISYRMKGSREFEGTFTLRVDPDDPTLLHGSFTSEAANTTGDTEVRILRE